MARPDAEDNDSSALALAVPPHLRVLYCTVAVTGYVAVLSGVTARLMSRRRADTARGKDETV